MHIFEPVFILILSARRPYRTSQVGRPGPLEYVLGDFSTEVQYSWYMIFGIVFFRLNLNFLNTSKSICSQWSYLPYTCINPPLDAPRPFSTGRVIPSSVSDRQTIHRLLKTVQQEATPRVAAQPDTTEYEDKRAAATLAAKLAEEQQAAPGGARGNDRPWKARCTLTLARLSPARPIASVSQKRWTLSFQKGVSLNIAVNVNSMSSWFCLFIWFLSRIVSLWHIRLIFRVIDAAFDRRSPRAHCVLSWSGPEIWLICVYT